MNISQICAEFCVVEDISFVADHFGAICSAETEKAVKEVK
jgi:hypothetical protein